MLRIPKQVRGMTMRAFGQKYEGNVQLALRGFQKERLAAAGGDATLGEIDKSMRKRKWVASQEADPDASGTGENKDGDSQRTTKAGALILLLHNIYMRRLTTRNSPKTVRFSQESSRVLYWSRDSTALPYASIYHQNSRNGMAHSLSLPRSAQ